MKSLQTPSVFLMCFLSCYPRKTLASTSTQALELPVLDKLRCSKDIKLKNYQCFYSNLTTMARNLAIRSVKAYIIHSVCPKFSIKNCRRIYHATLRVDWISFTQGFYVNFIPCYLVACSQLITEQNCSFLLFPTHKNKVIMYFFQVSAA